MFAVPGWAVPPAGLKSQSSELALPTTKQLHIAEESRKTSKKRKRHNGNSNSEEVRVTSKNLSNLWEAVIEEKSKPKSDGVALEDPDKSNNREINTGEGDDQADVMGTVTATTSQGPSKRAKKRETTKQKRGEKKARLQENTEATSSSSKALEARRAPTTELTPLQKSMRQKLISARFRHLNQILYTNPSTQSTELFQQNPEMFDEYHEGFRRQVEAWPENPVDRYVEEVRRRGGRKGPVRGKAIYGTVGGREIDDLPELPLPRSEGTCHIADLGCGDGNLSKRLDKEKKKLKVKISSFDLQSPNSFVRKADIADLPLDSSSVDVAVFCLALMGTNWIDFIEEAFRILRWKGELWIAEIKSRFGRVNSKKARVEHSVGNRKKFEQKVVKHTDENIDDMKILAEVDGHESRNSETDVSEFVEVLRTRGFILQDGKAVDLTNKMFVKMRFLKAQTPIKGKCIPIHKDIMNAGAETGKKKLKKRFIDADEEVVLNEASVLKPCVYKLR